MQPYSKINTLDREDEEFFFEKSIAHLRTHKSVQSCLADWKGKAVFIKRYPKPQGLLKFFKHILRGSNARCAIRGAELLIANGIAAPEPIALVEKTQYLKAKRTAAVFEAIKGGSQLAEFFYANKNFRSALIKRLAQEVARMHSLNIVHGDMSPHNIILTDTVRGLRFIWTDNRRTRRVYFLGNKLIVKNFSQLLAHCDWISERSKLRFLLSYAKFRGISKAQVVTIISLLNHRLRGRHALEAMPQCCRQIYDCQ